MKEILLGFAGGIAGGACLLIYYLPKLPTTGHLNRLHNIMEELEQIVLEWQQKRQ